MRYMDNLGEMMPPTVEGAHGERGLSLRVFVPKMKRFSTDIVKLTLLNWLAFFTIAVHLDDETISPSNYRQ